MKTKILYLLLSLVFPITAIAADNPISIKLKGYPVDGIVWGASPQELKLDPKDLECEQIKADKENLQEPRTECSYDMRHDNRAVSLIFTDNKLLHIYIGSGASSINKDLEDFTSLLGIEPTNVVKGSVKEIFRWISAYVEYKLQCDVKTQKCSLFIFPSQFVEISTRPPANSEFKILDLSLGHSRSKDFIQLASTNKWQWFKFDNSETYAVYDLGLKEVSITKFEFVDDTLESITHEFSNKKTKENYYNILAAKYGKPVEDSGYAAIWRANKGTKDEISIGLSYSKTHDIIKEVWYSHEALSAKGLDERLIKNRAKAKKAERVMKKAF